MAELYPDDSALLALDADEHTGVEYIPTGRSPYYLEFRKLVQRTLLAAARANDLRVYADGELTVGVRSGRCLIGGSPIDFDGVTEVPLVNNATTHLWLDDQGVVQAGQSGLPTDRTAFVPLAAVTTEAGAIAQLADLRGEALLAVPDLATLGLSATRAEIDQALSGLNATVDAAALNALTGGSVSDADTEHRHVQMYSDEDAETAFRLINDSGGASANVSLKFDLPALLPGDTSIGPDAATGYLRQRHLSDTFALVGSVHATYRHEGDLVGSLSGKLLGVVPIDGVVSDVIVSVGQNMASSNDGDGVDATVSVNGVSVTTTDPSITAADGAGFRSTAQGDGTVAAVKTDDTEQVSRGDVLTLDIGRTAAGSVSVEASDVVVLVVIRAGRPE